MTSVLFTLGRYYADELEAAGGRSLLASKRGRPARNATASGATEAALAPPAFEGFECDGGRNHVKLLQRYTWLGLGLGLGLGLANPNPNPNPNQIGEHVYQLCDHILYSSHLHLTRHALPPRVYASIDDAQADRALVRARVRTRQP